MIVSLSNLLSMGWRLKKQKPVSSPKLTIFISALVTICLFLLNESGSFQILEWIIYDQYFRLRPLEDTDSRLLLVTVDEPDISRLQQWPLSDAQLTLALTQIEEHAPRVIALDIYRDFPVLPGEFALSNFFKATPHLIGVEKIGGTPVPPPPILEAQGQVALADIVMDGDGTVRRALVTVQNKGKAKWSLGARAALEYLKQDDIVIDPTVADELTLSTGISFPRLKRSDGGYTRVDNRGYQILLNFRGPDNAFETVSIYDVLNGQVSGDLIRDRIVMIGAVAPSLNDFIYTPYGTSDITNTTQSPGVAVHAHIASQIVSATLDGRTNIRTWPAIAEWIWVLIWCSLGSGLILIPRWQGRNGTAAFLLMMLPVLGLSASLLIINGFWFVNGWWVPSVPPLLGIILSATTSLTASNLKLIKDAYVDGLTDILNRRAFNQEIIAAQRSVKVLSIVLCDIDYFKGFNDLYGHPAGDDCLRQVAKTIQQAVRSQDLVARYGGEEFAVILQNTPSEKALEIAERMRFKVQSCRIENAASPVSDYVSISCGVATRAAHDSKPLLEILSQADEALYQSKRAGRNRVSASEAA